MNASVTPREVLRLPVPPHRHIRLLFASIGRCSHSRFADALRSSPQPAWSPAAASPHLAIDLAGLRDTAFDIRDVDRVVEAASYFFALRFVFFAVFFAAVFVFAFFAFFAMLPS